ncbi:hypothetical protein Pelo_7332 [Pelomyxa schiedti]|nr:hypothetical protein Pelo_7332 [Pelomyxa schiedti]
MQLLQLRTGRLGVSVQHGSLTGNTPDIKANKSKSATCQGKKTAALQRELFIYIISRWLYHGMDSVKHRFRQISVAEIATKRQVTIEIMPTLRLYFNCLLLRFCFGLQILVSREQSFEGDDATWTIGNAKERQQWKTKEIVHKGT